MAENIFLDFLNRDSRQIFGLFEASKAVHLSQLASALNVAVFLCDEYCIVPPGFIAECELARFTVSRRIKYVEERLILFPLREETIESFFAKKEEEYRSVSKAYGGLFDPKARSLLMANPLAIVRRESRIGDGMVNSWEAGPDDDAFWRILTQKFAPSQIEIIRSVPRVIRDQGSAVTWPSIQEELRRQIQADVQKVRHAVQHEYFSLYLSEFNLRVIRNLPFARDDFGLGQSEHDYDYELLRLALSNIGCWKFVSEISAESLIKLRRINGFRRFRDAWSQLTRSIPARRDIVDLFSRIEARHRAKLRRMHDDLSKIAGNVVPIFGHVFSPEHIEVLGDHLELAGKSGLEYLAENKLENSETPCTSEFTARRKSVTKQQREGTVAIYCALAEERKILTDRWKFGAYGETNHWSGTVSGVDTVLFSSNDMGRVPAAIATMNFLAEQQGRVQVLLVIGIAGGFAQEGVRVGDVLLATQVADLATRKIRENKEGVIREFRQRAFSVDKRLDDFVNSGHFDRKAWEQKTIDDAEWPEGFRPNIRSGTIASTDEVVSSDQWSEELRNNWAKLLGIEMETGGVCAAAEIYDVKVVVVRGVSDLADAAKADTEWRKRSMKAIASLLEMAFEHGVF